MTKEPIIVSAEEIDRFNLCIAVANLRRSSLPMSGMNATDMLAARRTRIELPYYFYENDYLAVSVDNKWYPYLCNVHTRSLNPQRFYIPMNGLLLRMTTAMQEDHAHFNGAKMLLNSAGVFRAPSDSPTELLRWQIEGELGYLRQLPGQDEGLAVGQAS